MAKKDKRQNGSAPTPNVPAIPAEIKKLLEAATRPPQRVDTSEDARATTLAVMAETIAVGFQIIGVISEHVTSAPYHQTTESRQ